jgi:TPR repeat protein
MMTRTVELMVNARNEMKAIEAEKAEKAEKVKPCPFAPLTFGNNETEKIRLLKLASDQGLDRARQAMKAIPRSLKKGEEYQEFENEDSLLQNNIVRSAKTYQIFQSDSTDIWEPDKACALLLKDESKDEDIDDEDDAEAEAALNDCMEVIALRNKAVSGDRDAQFEFALYLFSLERDWSYLSSRFLPHGRWNQDFVEAAASKWMLRAAHANQVNAQYSLARYCFERDNRMCGVAWMLKAAQQGHEDAWEEVPPEGKSKNPLAAIVDLTTQGTS